MASLEPAASESSDAQHTTEPQPPQPALTKDEDAVVGPSTDVPLAPLPPTQDAEGRGFSSDSDADDPPLLPQDERTPTTQVPPTQGYPRDERECKDPPTSATTQSHDTIPQVEVPASEPVDTGTASQAVLNVDQYEVEADGRPSTCAHTGGSGIEDDVATHATATAEAEDTPFATEAPAPSEHTAEMAPVDGQGDDATQCQDGCNPHQQQPSRFALDLQVGTWCEHWPRDITSIINVDRHAVVRYFRGLRKLDLIRMVAVNKAGGGGTSSIGIVPPSMDSEQPKCNQNYEARICDSTWISSLPNISTLHHFTIEKPGSDNHHTKRPQEGDEERRSPTATLMSCVLCVADDLKRCIVFSLNNDKFEQLNVTSLPMKASHVVPFSHRGASYFLTYYANSGEYGILPFRSVATGTPQLVAKGQFRAGWTDVVWKGTYHVRCTRQKFFCYNNASGESVFECVWVRGQSSSSSVCSAEHVTMQTKGGGGGRASVSQSTAAGEGGSGGGPLSAVQNKEEDVAAALHRKSCIVVPMIIGGKFSAMLYSHSTFANGGQRRTSLTQRRQSTGRLMESGSLVVDRSTTQLTRSMTMYNVAEAASLLLRKRVFSHAEPWTHFTILSDFGEEPLPLDLLPPTDADGTSSAPLHGHGPSLIGLATMLCYSAVSGEVWINSMYFTEQARIQQDVTVFEGTVPHPAPRHRAAAPAKGGAGSLVSRTPGDNALQKHLHGKQRYGQHLGDGGGVDVHHFIAEQVDRKSPFDHPVDGFDDLRSGRASRQSNRSRGLALDDDAAPRGGGTGRPPHPQRPPGSADGGMARITSSFRLAAPVPASGTARPSSSSLSLSHRLRTLPSPTGDYREDIAQVIRHISVTDFNEDAPYPRVALAQVPRLPAFDARLALLNSRPQSGSNSAGDALISTHHVETATITSGTSRYGSASLRSPWKPASAADVYVPAPPQSPAAKFDRAYGQHVAQDVPPKLASNDAVNARLYRPDIDARALYQANELEKVYKELAKKQVDFSIDRNLVAKTVEKLSVADVAQRRKRDAERIAEREAMPSPEIHDGIVLTSQDVQSVSERLHDQAIATRRAHLEHLKQKLYAEANRAVATGVSPPLASPPRSSRLTQAEQDQHVRRLDQESVHHKQLTMQRIAQQMDDEFRRHAYDNFDPTHTLPERETPQLTLQEREALGLRLYKNEERSKVAA